MINKDSVEWFPMRSTYGREQIVKKQLDQLGIDNYVPMTSKIVEIKGKRHRQVVPAVRNLIFVHSSMRTISNLKRDNMKLSSLRFMKRKSIYELDILSLIVTVPINQMNNFIKATKDHEDAITYLCNEQGSCAVGQKIRITSGTFCGVEGQIRRIQKNKRVLVTLDGISTVMLNFVPKELMEQIADTHYPNKPGKL